MLLKNFRVTLAGKVRRRVRATMGRDRTELVIYRARGIIYTDCSASNQSLFRVPTFLQMIRIFSQLRCILYESSTVKDIPSPEVQRLSSPTLYPLSSREGCEYKLGEERKPYVLDYTETLTGFVRHEGRIRYCSLSNGYEY